MPASNRFSDRHALRINRFGKEEKPLHCESNYHARNFENASIARKRRIPRANNTTGHIPGKDGSINLDIDIAQPSKTKSRRHLSQ